jgi:FtsH-binding integral membrane protein
VKTTHLLAPTVLSTYIWNEPVAWQRLFTVVQWFGALIVAVLFIVFLCEWLWRPEARAVKLAPLAVFVVLFAASCIPFITDARGGMPVETILLAICVPTVFDMLSLGQSKDASSASVNHPDTPLVRATRVELKE